MISWNNTIKKIFYRIGGWVLVVWANIFLWFSYAGSSSSLTTDIDLLFSRGDYTTIIAHSDQYAQLDTRDLEKLVLSFMKLWYYQEAYTILDTRPLIDPTLQQLHRILVFYNQEDWNKILDFLRGRSDPNPAVRSLFLQMRAKALYNKRMYFDAAMIATDAVSIDPLASAPTALQAMILASQRERQEAFIFFERAENLGSYVGDQYWYYKWLSEFYTRNREDMLESFANISPESEYMYAVHVFIARHWIENQEYDRALEQLYTAESLDPSARSHKMRTWKAFNRMWDHQRALQAQQIAFERSGTSPHPELLADMLESLVNTNSHEQLRTILTLLPDRIGTNQMHHEHFIRWLLRAWLYEQAYLQWIRSIEILDRMQDTTTIQLHDMVMQAIIHSLIENTWTAFEQERLDRLVAYHWSMDKSRFLYMALWDYKQWDTSSAMRAIHEIDPTATAHDLRIIQILHHLMANNPRWAIQRLLGFSDDPDMDIDFQWLKWKAMSLLQDWAAAYREETEGRLRALQQLTNEHKESEDINQLFLRRFNTWLVYMRPFYQ